MHKLARELNSQEKLENIKKIQFGIFSHDDIENGAVAEIYTSDTYDGGMPKNNGLFDNRMGVIDRYLTCPTDMQDYKICPGYFGKIKLAKPVFNFHFLSLKSISPNTLANSCPF